MRDIIWILVTPAALVSGALIGTYRNRLPPRTGLGLQLPSVRHTLIFSAVFVGLMAAHESLYDLLGLKQQSNWRRYDPSALAVRVLFATFIYPTLPGRGEQVIASRGDAYRGSGWALSLCGTGELELIVGVGEGEPLRRTTAVSVS